MHEYVTYLKKQSVRYSKAFQLALRYDRNDLAGKYSVLQKVTDIHILKLKICLLKQGLKLAA